MWMPWQTQQCSSRHRSAPWKQQRLLQRRCPSKGSSRVLLVATRQQQRLRVLLGVVLLLLVLVVVGAHSWRGGYSGCVSA
jgi:hypothetical protein